MRKEYEKVGMERSKVEADLEKAKKVWLGKAEETKKLKEHGWTARKRRRVAKFLGLIMPSDVEDKKKIIEMQEKSESLRKESEELENKVLGWIREKILIEEVKEEEKKEEEVKLTGELEETKPISKESVEDIKPGVIPPPPPPPPVLSREEPLEKPKFEQPRGMAELMSQIRGGVSLKEVEVEEGEKSGSKKEIGGITGFAEAIAKRRAAMGEEEVVETKEEIIIEAERKEREEKEKEKRPAEEIKKIIEVKEGEIPPPPPPPPVAAAPAEIKIAKVIPKVKPEEESAEAMSKLLEELRYPGRKLKKVEPRKKEPEKKEEPAWMAGLKKKMAEAGKGAEEEPEEKKEFEEEERDWE